jgi:alpha-ketoglutarate-dependent taurine dioxygenase
MRVEEIDATLGATLSDVQLAELGQESRREIESAFSRHALLIFPRQALSTEQQVIFGQRFGEIEHLFGDAGFVPISNQ